MERGGQLLPSYHLGSYHLGLKLTSCGLIHHSQKSMCKKLFGSMNSLSLISCFTKTTPSFLIDMFNPPVDIESYTLFNHDQLFLFLEICDHHRTATTNILIEYDSGHYTDNEISSTLNFCISNNNQFNTNCNHFVQITYFAFDTFPQFSNNTV